MFTASELILLLDKFKSEDFEKPAHLAVVKKLFELELLEVEKAPLLLSKMFELKINTLIDEAVFVEKFQKLDLSLTEVFGNYVQRNNRNIISSFDETQVNVWNFLKKICLLKPENAFKDLEDLNLNKSVIPLIVEDFKEYDNYTNIPPPVLQDMCFFKRDFIKQCLEQNVLQLNTVLSNGEKLLSNILTQPSFFMNMLPLLLEKANPSNASKDELQELNFIDLVSNLQKLLEREDFKAVDELMVENVALKDKHGRNLLSIVAILDTKNHYLKHFHKTKTLSEKDKNYWLSSCDQKDRSAALYFVMNAVPLNVPSQASFDKQYTKIIEVIRERNPNWIELIMCNLYDTETRSVNEDTYSYVRIKNIPSFFLEALNDNPSKEALKKIERKTFDYIIEFMEKKAKDSHCIENQKFKDLSDFNLFVDIKELNAHSQMIKYLSNDFGGNTNLVDWNQRHEEFKDWVQKMNVNYQEVKVLNKHLDNNRFIPAALLKMLKDYISDKHLELQLKNDVKKPLMQSSINSLETSRF